MYLNHNDQGDEFTCLNRGVFNKKLRFCLYFCNENFTKPTCIHFYQHYQTLNSKHVSTWFFLDRLLTFVIKHFDRDVNNFVNTCTFLSSRSDISLSSSILWERNKYRSYMHWFILSFFYIKTIRGLHPLHNNLVLSYINDNIHQS